jgi:hypothetical protein
MSQKNVVEIIRRKSDGALFEVLHTPRMKAYVAGFRFLRVGPAGQTRHKRRWESIEALLRDYELVTEAIEVT